jgi:D-glycero-beta-D-manno-heptose-7-phosphate kinase
MNNLEDINILVLGDIMLDRYICGNVSRISPEAPVPVVEVFNEYNNLGGCGNVVRNLRSMGVNCACLAVVGTDKTGQTIINELKNTGANSMIVQIEGRQSTLKERIVAGYRQIQMLRVDREERTPVNSALLLRKLTEHKTENFDAILISDYDKGVINDIYFIDSLKSIFPNAFILVDPKPKNIPLYDSVMMITPNEKEFQEIKDRGHLPFVEKHIPYVLETQGRKGMTLHELSGFEYNTEVIPTDPVEVFNVSGAGDCVLAVLGVCLSRGIKVLTASKIANDCAHYVVTQVGTSVIPENKFIESITKYKSDL